MFFDVSDKLDLIKCKIEWKIYDLKLRKEFLGNDQVLTSKNFYNPKYPSVVWELRIYPHSYNGYGSNSKIYVSITQIGLKEEKVSLLAKYNIYAHDIEGKRVDICLNSNAISFAHKTEAGKYEIDLQKVCHADGSVLLYCEVEFVPHNIKCVNNNNQIVNNQIEERNLLRDLFESRKLSDFVIKIGDEKINVHRCILAQNSYVFLTMFEQNNMIEAKNGELEIVDSSPECVKAMIEYFYLGQINTSNLLENNVDDLYAIAHKYEVYSLMSNCENIMASNIDQENFAKRCSFSQLYGLTSVEKACVKYIAANRKNFLNSKEWKDFRSKNKNFAIRLTESALKTG